MLSLKLRPFGLTVSPFEAWSYIGGVGAQSCGQREATGSSFLDRSGSRARRRAVRRERSSWRQDDWICVRMCCPNKETAPPFVRHLHIICREKFRIRPQSELHFSARKGLTYGCSRQASPLGIRYDLRHSLNTLSPPCTIKLGTTWAATDDAWNLKRAISYGDVSLTY